MNVWLAWALAGPGFVSYAALRAGAGGRRAIGAPLAAALAPAMGLGSATCSYFVALVATGSHAWAVRLDALIWLAGLAALSVRVRAQGEASGRNWSPRQGSSVAVRVCALGFLAMAVVAGAAYWWRWQAYPFGEWDAWAIWNLRARAISRGAPDWADILSPGIAWSHPDYPLLVPLTIARLWAYAGSESTLTPALVALLYFISIVAVVVASVSQLRGAAAGMLSGTALLAAPALVDFAACQCADVPLAFYAVAAVSLAAVSRKSADGLAAPVAAGGAAALAAWTKNEGLVVLAATLVLMAAFPGARSRLRVLAALMVGAAPVMLVVGWFKWGFAPTNYLLAQGQTALVARLRDFGRVRFVWDQLWPRVWSWGSGPVSGLAATAIAVGLAARVDRAGAARAGVATLFLAGMLGSVALAYVLTPADVRWQIATSFDRVLVQVWPVIVWAAFQLTGREVAANTSCRDRGSPDVQ